MSGAPILVWPMVLGDPDRWAPLLSVDEHARAAQFRRARDAAEYVTCRGVLRALLGDFLSRDPASLRFAYGAHEKPGLEDGACAFNVSRSNGLALIAISAAGSLGIDLEHVRADIDVAALAAEFLASSQCAAVATAHDFFRFWVRHEAGVKATGGGLVVPAQDDVPNVWVQDLEIGRDYVAAIAADGINSREVVLCP
jgi:4'-phosphopantetheinyl transferase